MLKNYFKTACRNMLNSKGYSAQYFGTGIRNGGCFNYWLVGCLLGCLVLISCVIASPLAYYFLQGWLQKYAYRIDIGIGVFIVAAGLAIVITLITISFQSIKAAVMNPVKSLRAE